MQSAARGVFAWKESAHASDTWDYARTLEVVIQARAAVLHFVTRKLRAWPAPRETQARKVHSSL